MFAGASKAHEFEVWLVFFFGKHFKIDRLDPSLFHNKQLTSKLAALLTQAVNTPNQSGVKVSEFFSGKSCLATLF